MVESKENRINVANIGLTQSERLRMTQLRFHALIAKAKNHKDKHIANTWLITKRGADFIHGRVAVPSWVKTYQNRVVGHSPDLINKSKFKVLDDFRPTHEIIENKATKVPELQMKFL